jgi:hypothetical protein
MGAFRWLPLASALLAAVPTPSVAQDSPGSGFLFERPRVSVGFRGGIFLHRAESDLYDFADQRFTVDPSDFRGLSFGVEGAAWIGDRLEVAFGMDASRVTLRSEYLSWMEEDGSPIRQTTRVTHGPSMSFGARYYAAPRGEALGRFAWVPTRANLFVGGGGSITGYRVEMTGDFVDEVDEIIYAADLDSTGTAFLPFLSGGLELGLSSRTAVSLEGRYHWGSAELGSDFRDDAGQPVWEPFDLAGARFTVGLSFRI